jgi:Fe-S cluster assembly ATP-binding protein
MNQSPASALLQIEDLHVRVEGKEILRGVDLTVNRGEVHALMGRNGSGKSTLSNAIMGHPRYEVTGGRIVFQGQDLADLATDERARLGIFLAFQYPMAIPGVTVANFLRAAMRAACGADAPLKDFRRTVTTAMDALGVDHAFATRYANDGFSGGEKKRLEMLQMTLLQPTLAVLDETDSGLDIDALRVVSEGINRLRSPERGFLVVTHYQRILRYVQPDRVHVMIDGRIVRSGGPDLAFELEERGYDWLDADAGVREAAR